MVLTIHSLLLLIAGLLFILNSFGVNSPRVSLLALGLFFFCIAFLF